MTTDQATACEAFVASITEPLNDRIQGLSTTNDRLTRDLAAAQDSLNTANLAVSDRDSQITALKQQAIDAQNREMAGGADAECDAALAQVATLTEQLSKASTDMESLRSDAQAQIATLEHQNADLQARLDKAISDLQAPK